MFETRLEIQPRRALHPQFSYRIRQLDTLKAKTSEEERLEEINKQIYNLQSMKQVSVAAQYFFERKKTSCLIKANLNDTFE